MKTDLLGIGRRVRELRLQRDLTQNELAALTGTAPSTLYRIEYGITAAQSDTIQNLAQALGVPEQYLLRGEGPPSLPGPVMHEGEPMVPLSVAEFIASGRVKRITRADILFLAVSAARGVDGPDDLEFQLLAERARTAPPERYVKAAQALADKLAKRAVDNQERSVSLSKPGSMPPPPPNGRVRAGGPRARQKRSQ